MALSVVSEITLRDKQVRKLTFFRKKILGFPSFLVEMKSFKINLDLI